MANPHFKETYKQMSLFQERTLVKTKTGRRQPFNTANHLVFLDCWGGVRAEERSGDKVRSEQARVITAGIIFLYHLFYAPVGFLGTDVISREINGNLSRHSHTCKCMNKYTCAISCIHIHTQTESQFDANPECMWKGTRAVVWKVGMREEQSKWKKKRGGGKKVRAERQEGAGLYLISAEVSIEQKVQQAGSVVKPWVLL